jgi:transposase-like protein
VGRRGYPPEFRRKVLDLLAAGRTVADVALALARTTHRTHGWVEAQ